MQAKITEYVDMTQKKEEEDVSQEAEFGPIPQDWKVVSLKDVVRSKDGIKRGPWGGSIKKEIFVSSGYKVYEQKNIIENNFEIGNYFLDESKFNELKDFEVQEGDILLTAAGTIGKVAIAPSNVKRGIINQALIRIRLNEKLIDPVYFKLRFEHDRARLREFSHGAVLVNISSVKALQQFPILLPPFPEQQKIAKVLGSIQRAIEQQDKIIEAAKNLKKSLMQKLFTEGLGHTEFKETEIGTIPASWEAVKLLHVVDFSKKPRDLNLNSFEKIPFITMEMIPIEKTYVNDFLLKEPNKISSGVYCEKGDILLPKITPCFENGKQGIIKNIPYDFAFATTEVYPIKPKNDQLDKMFLFYFLANPNVRRTIADKMQGTTGRRRVPKDVVKNTLIPLPHVPEQREIARILSTVDKKIEAEERKKATLNELFKTMLHKLMTAEIRVKDVEV